MRILEFRILESYIILELNTALIRIMSLSALAATGDLHSTSRTSYSRRCRIEFCTELASSAQRKQSKQAPPPG